MTDDRLHLALIIGSTREGRFGPTVARWFADVVRRRRDMALDVIDLAEVALPAIYPSGPSPAVQAYTERIDRADAFVVVTPEYNHGYPASLKQAIDLPGPEWRRKPVGFVSYGGMAGGVRAVEQLRQVFPELQATTVRDTVSFHSVWGLFGPSGRPTDPDGCGTAAETMLEDLSWWGRALRAARRADDVDSLEESA